MATDITTEPDVESAESLVKRFADLTVKFKEETRHSSEIKTRLENPAFGEIVAMGEKAVPLILWHLEKNDGFLFLALEKIIGVEPIPKEIYGKNEEMRKTWIAWGRAKGYRW